MTDKTTPSETAAKVEAPKNVSVSGRITPEEREALTEIAYDQRIPGLIPGAVALAVREFIEKYAKVGDVPTK